MHIETPRPPRTGCRRLELRGLSLATLLVLAACSRPAPSAPSEGDTEAAPAVLIVIIDGLRPDAVARADTPNLDRLAEEGAYTAEAAAVMPAITRTNFVTFATGAHADRHGIIGGVYLDEAWEEQKTDGPTLDAAQANLPVPTIFEAAEASGLRAGMLGMKGYELVGARGARVAIGGADIFPAELWEGRYDREDGGSIEEAVRRRLRKNDLIVDRLEEVLAGEPLDLVLVNLGATDYVAHAQGPDSDHYIRAIEATDAVLPEVRDIVRTANPHRDWHLIVGADHGFSQVNPETVVVPHLDGVFEVDELIAADIEHRIYERGGRAAELYVRDPAQVARAAEIVQGLSWVRRIYVDDEVPGRAGSLDDLRVAYPGRHGSIYLITEPPHAFAYANLGQHGSDDPEDRTVPIWLAGAQIGGVDLDLAGASNADIGPTALTLLGLDPGEALEASGRSLVPTPAAVSATTASAHQARNRR